MKAQDVVTQLAVLLPRFTDAFTRNFSIVSLTRAGTTVTATTDADHDMEVGDQANVIGAQVPIPVSALTRAGTVGTMVTDTPHDFTKWVQSEVELTGSNEAEFNGAFPIIDVLNRLTATFEMPDAGPVAATGSPLVLNGASALTLAQYNGLKNVTAVPATDQFQYELTDPAVFTPPAGTIAAKTEPRISAVVNEQRIIDVYTRQPPADFWAWVVLGPTFSSKDRLTQSDAVADMGRGENYKQDMVQSVSVYIAIPTADQIAARKARDQIEDLRRPLFRSILSSSFDSGLFVGAQKPLVFNDDGAFLYNAAYYVHRFTFQQTSDITFDDTIGYDVDVAFRDILLEMGVSTGTEIMTARIDLDDEPLPSP